MPSIFSFICNLVFWRFNFYPLIYLFVSRYTSNLYRLTRSKKKFARLFTSFKYVKSTICVNRVKFKEKLFRKQKTLYHPGRSFFNLFQNLSNSSHFVVIYWHYSFSRAWIFKTSKMIPLHCFSEVSKILPNIFFSKKMILNPQEVIKIEHMHAWHFSFDSGQTRLTKEGVSSNPLEEHEFFLCSNYFILYAFILYIDLKWSQKFWVIYINNRFIYKQCVIKHWNII